MKPWEATNLAQPASVSQVSGLAAADVGAELVELRVRLGGRDGVVGLEPRLLEDEVLVDKALDDLVACVAVVAFVGQGLEGGEALLLVDIAFEYEVAVDDGEDLVDEGALGRAGGGVDGLRGACVDAGVRGGGAVLLGFEPCTKQGAREQQGARRESSVLARREAHACLRASPGG